MKVGIAGYGIVGKRRRTFIDQHESLELAAVADITFDESGKLPDGTRYYKSYLDLINNESLDLLFVCLSNDVAADATIVGLESGFHVFCEKPPGRSVEDVRRVRRIEEKNPHLKLKYGFNHRYHDSIREAIRLMESKELGEVINIRGVYGKSVMVNFASDWRHNREIAGGGILLDQGIHMVDLLRAFAGEFSQIHSFVSNDHWGHEVEDNAYALMKSEKGVVAQLHSTATEWRHRFNLQVTLTHGLLIMSGILSGTKSYGQEQLTIVYRGDNDRGMPKEQRITYIEDNSLMWTKLMNFTNALKPIKQLRLVLVLMP